MHVDLVKKNSSRGSLIWETSSSPGIGLLPYPDSYQSGWRAGVFEDFIHTLASELVFFSYCDLHVHV